MADDTFVIKRNDTWRPMRLALEVATVKTPSADDPAHWTPLEIPDGTTVRVLIRAGTAVIATREAEVLDPSLPDPYNPAATEPVGEGQIVYDWQDSDENSTGTPDTAATGSYRAEVELTYSNEKRETVPRKGYFTVDITEDLGPVA